MGTRANLRYDHPSFLVRRTASILTVIGNATVNARFRPYINARLIGCHALVVTKGAATGGNDLVIKNVSPAGTSTTILGTFSLGTEAALVESSITAMDSTMALGDEINITNGTDTVAETMITYEYELNPGGTFST